MFIVVVLVRWLVVVAEVVVEEMRVVLAIVLVGEFGRGEMTGSSSGGSGGGSSSGSSSGSTK